MGQTNWGHKKDAAPISQWDRRLEGDVPTGASGIVSDPIVTQGGFTTTSGFQLFDDNYFHFGTDKDWKIGFSSAVDCLFVTAEVENNPNTPSIMFLTPTRSLLTLWGKGMMTLPHWHIEAAPTGGGQATGTLTYVDGDEKGLYLYD